MEIGYSILGIGYSKIKTFLRSLCFIIDFSAKFAVQFSIIDLKNSIYSLKHRLKENVSIFFIIFLLSDGYCFSALLIKSANFAGFSGIGIPYFPLPQSSGVPPEL